MLPEVTEIKRRRKALGLSQAELAGKARISRTSLVKLENGDSDLRYSKVKEIFRHIRVFRKQQKSGIILPRHDFKKYTQPTHRIRVS